MRTFLFGRESSPASFVCVGGGSNPTLPKPPVQVSGAQSISPYFEKKIIPWWPPKRASHEVLSCKTALEAQVVSDLNFLSILTWVLCRPNLWWTLALQGYLPTFSQHACHSGFDDLLNANSAVEWAHNSSLAVFSLYYQIPFLESVIIEF